MWLQARLAPLHPKRTAQLALLAAAQDSLFAGRAPAPARRACCLHVRMPALRCALHDRRVRSVTQTTRAARGRPGTLRPVRGRVLCSCTTVGEVGEGVRGPGAVQLHDSG